MELVPGKDFTRYESQGLPNPEEEPEVAQMVEEFRKLIAERAKSPINQELEGIDVSKLGEDDLALFDRLEKGLLSTEKVDSMISLLNNSIGLDTEDSVKFLKYLKKEISRRDAYNRM